MNTSVTDAVNTMTISAVSTMTSAVYTVTSTMAKASTVASGVSVAEKVESVGRGSGVDVNRSWSMNVPNGSFVIDVLNGRRFFLHNIYVASAGYESH